MDAVRQWAFSACTALIACAIAWAVIPEGGIKKIFSITVSVFFLCCLLSPVVLGNPALAVDIRENSIEDIQRRANLMTDMAAAQSETAASAAVEKIVIQKLEEMGIKYIGVTINISTNIPRSGGAEGFEIAAADITLAKEHEDRHESIRRELERSLGFDIRLGYV